MYPFLLTTFGPLFSMTPRNINSKLLSSLPTTVRAIFSLVHSRLLRTLFLFPPARSFSTFFSPPTVKFPRNTKVLIAEKLIPGTERQRVYQKSIPLDCFFVKATYVVDFVMASSGQNKWWWGKCSRLNGFPVSLLRLFFVSQTPRVT